jgi:hypothetical protein
MCTRWYTWWLAHFSKGGEVGEVKEVFFTVKQWPDAGPDSGPMCPVIGAVKGMASVEWPDASARWWPDAQWPHLIDADVWWCCTGGRGSEDLTLGYVHSGQTWHVQSAFGRLGSLLDSTWLCVRWDCSASGHGAALAHATWCGLTRPIIMLARPIVL